MAELAARQLGKQVASPGPPGKTQHEHDPMAREEGAAGDLLDENRRSPSRPVPTGQPKRTKDAEAAAFGTNPGQPRSEPIRGRKWIWPHEGRSRLSHDRGAVHTARAEPVAIEKQGRPVIAVLSVEEYERLLCIRDGLLAKAEADQINSNSG